MNWFYAMNKPRLYFLLFSSTIVACWLVISILLVTFNYENQSTSDSECQEIDEGEAKCDYKNGERYKGGFRYGKKNGNGTLHTVSGSMYVGEFHDDKRHGHGVFYMFNGGRFEGQFENDYISGRGSIYWPDGNRFDGEFRSDSSIVAPGYEEIRFDQVSAVGVMYMSNGDKYESVEFKGRVI